MRPYSEREAGVSLVEMMTALFISTLAISGAMQLWSKHEKSLTYQNATEAAKAEESEFALTLRKIWDFRLREATPGIPNTGFRLSRLDGTPCTTNCPRMSAYVRRTIEGASIIDEITISNTCRSLQGSALEGLTASMNFASQMNSRCSLCKKGETPLVQMTGIIRGTKKISLAAENRAFPVNLIDPKLARPFLPMGTQICFSQASANVPLTVDYRSLLLSQDEKGLRLYQKTQVHALSNFAAIRLEQAP